MAVKCLKLVSGEEVIGETTELESKTIIENPVVLMMVGEGQMAMIPWLPIAEKQTITILKTGIIAYCDVKNELINNYKRITGGIVTAPAGALNRLEKPF